MTMSHATGSDTPSNTQPPSTNASPGASYSVTIRLRYANRPGALGLIASAIGEAGGDIGAVNLVHATPELSTRDITVNASSSNHADGIVATVRGLDTVELLDVEDRVFRMHRGGKISVVSKSPVATRDDLSMAYTPGVARVCQAIHQDPDKAYTLTIKQNTVAVVSDGTAVLGLGDIGPAAAMPVMEGKAMLFKEFAGVDAFPICLDTKDVDEIVRTVVALAPTFGGINLEDISAPRCFEIEDRLKAALSIPVFHDDQHGTAVVLLAGLMNALKIVGKRMEDLKGVVNGVGAAGVACTKILLAAGVTRVVGCDTSGAIYRGRTANMNSLKQWYADHTNPAGEQGSVSDVLVGADVFVGVSAPRSITVDDVKRMAANPIVFAMANPTPEIMPEEAAGHVAVMATGRSDYPNQINNALCFPGIFRGALACRASTINEEMKLAAAHAIAGVVSPTELGPEYIIPSVFDRRVVDAVAQAVMAAARATGVARAS